MATQLTMLYTPLYGEVINKETTFRVQTEAS